MNVCTCGNPTRDDGYVCEPCLKQLYDDLGDCAWLHEELDISITRQRGAATTGGANSGETALPWHDKASEAQRDLHATLSTWVRLCDEEHVRNSAPIANYPINTIVSMSRWLLWRVDGLAFLDAGYEAVRDIGRAVERARNIVFYKPLPKMYLGTCATTLEDNSTCPGDVYASVGEAFGYCDLCGSVHSVDKRREAMTEELDSRLCTAAEIARLTTYLGLHVDRQQVRKQVNQWHTRKVISPAIHDADGNPLFSYGKVRVLLYAKYATRDEASA